MSSSSSDSDSDDYEPVRRFKINIRPKDGSAAKTAADVSAIKASVQAWRPLGPPTHPSLSRRQSSLSSVSSMSIGAGSGHGFGSIHSNLASGPIGGNNTSSGDGQSSDHFSGAMHSSPSCSSLVNEFNKPSFSNFMSTMSRTSSPLTLANHHNDSSVPVAIAIQESIELIVKGVYNPNVSEPKFESRCLGNIKVAFPFVFASKCCSTNNIKSIPVLKLRMNSTKNITKYYASRLIKDLDLKANGDAEQVSSSSDDTLASSETTTSEQKINLAEGMTLSRQGNSSPDSRIVEFDMDALSNHLRRMQEQNPRSRYYNIDVLRYQIKPIKYIKESPLQVCAYWKIEPKLVKIRIDFKHSSDSGLSLERLRELTFTVDLAKFIPPGVDINSLSPDSMSSIRLNNNNNGSISINTNFDHNSIDETDGIPSSSLNSTSSSKSCNISVISDAFVTVTDSQVTENSQKLPSPSVEDTSSICNEEQNQKTHCNNSMPPPYITHEPQAHWNSSSKRLTWRFDNLLSYYKRDGLGSLFAKLDFRNSNKIQFPANCKPTPVDVRFLVVDSTKSKISMSIDSTGYRLSLLKKELRSGRYRSEPYIL